MRDLLDDKSAMYNWCDHPRDRHAYPRDEPPQCHDCKSGYCTPKRGRVARVNRQLRKRWEKREK